MKGPICIFGAGGFVGVNLLIKLLKNRQDVYGISRHPQTNWRLKTAKIPNKNLVQCDINQKSQLQKLLNKLKPRTVFNLAAYGAYSSQRDLTKIYQTNFLAEINLLETLKKHNLSAYVYAGSSSEYGLNSKSPSENAVLKPNSHYAVSKIGASYLHQYYGKIETLPVVHLRFYSVYGPWEEPSRLIPTLIKAAKAGRYPVLVNPEISHDFIHVDDVVSVMVTVATGLKKRDYGEIFNLGTGKKTTIRQLARIIKTLYHIKSQPRFGSMPNRAWDLTDWYGNYDKLKQRFGWRPQISLKEGLAKLI